MEAASCSSRRHEYAYDSSPNGRFLAYVEKNDWWIYDIEKDERQNLTKRLGEGFINRERGTLTDEPSP